MTPVHITKRALAYLCGREPTDADLSGAGACDWVQVDANEGSLPGRNIGEGDVRHRPNRLVEIDCPKCLDLMARGLAAKAKQRAEIEAGR